ncbi:hypothetical protein BpHYR1_010632 [Brachionus plicatilis]|uniref:Uncharacterized protein n=1 Tax=Brachionus plicatilis TaxID=10195 RepID=A0A3M7S6K3_BRAPC|nr:hypothetical protein BpHYR1_010632 [Brachionus plicatilis]
MIKFKVLLLLDQNLIPYLKRAKFMKKKNHLTIIIEIRHTCKYFLFAHQFDEYLLCNEINARQIVALAIKVCYNLNT